MAPTTSSSATNTTARRRNFREHVQLWRSGIEDYKDSFDPKKTRKKLDAEDRLRLEDRERTLRKLRDAIGASGEATRFGLGRARVVTSEELSGKELLHEWGEIAQLSLAAFTLGYREGKEKEQNWERKVSPGNTAKRIVDEIQHGKEHVMQTASELRAPARQPGIATPERNEARKYSTRSTSFSATPSVCGLSSPLKGRRGFCVTVAPIIRKEDRQEREAGGVSLPHGSKQRSTGWDWVPPPSAVPPEEESYLQSVAGMSSDCDQVTRCFDAEVLHASSAKAFDPHLIVDAMRRVGVCETSIITPSSAEGEDFDLYDDSGPRDDDEANSPDVIVLEGKKADNFPLSPLFADTLVLANARTWAQVRQTIRQVVRAGGTADPPVAKTSFSRHDYGRSCVCLRCEGIVVFVFNLEEGETMQNYLAEDGFDNDGSMTLEEFRERFTIDDEDDSSVKSDSEEEHNYDCVWDWDLSGQGEDRMEDKWEKR